MRCAGWRRRCRCRAGESSEVQSHRQFWSVWKMFLCFRKAESLSLNGSVAVSIQLRWHWRVSNDDEPDSRAQGKARPERCHLLGDSPEQVSRTRSPQCRRLSSEEREGEEVEYANSSRKE